MAKRHQLRPGDWDSAAHRLEEIVAAHTGEDPFDELFKLLVVQTLSESDGAELPRTPQGIDRVLEQARIRWPGVLEGPCTTRLRGPELVRCLDILGALDLRASGLFGLDALFENLVSRASKGAKGQFFTPRHVVREAVRMLDLQPGERVCDPACGSGAFLIHALLEQPSCETWGFDLDPRGVRMGRLMVAALGQDPGRITRGDSLAVGTGAGIERRVRAQDPGFEGFDVIATNPPFAGDVGDTHQDAYELAAGGRVERDVLFLERCVRLLKPGGRLAIVLPHNKFGAKRWGAARGWLLRHVRPVAVVGLGRPTFLPHTSQKACIFVGVRRAAPRAQVPTDEDLLFFVSDRPGKDRTGRLILRGEAGEDPWDRVDHDLAEATAAVRQGRAPAGGRLSRRSLGGLDEPWVLAPERYDPRREVAGPASATVGDLASLSTASWKPGDDERVLVLDTSHAFEGVVRYRHAPVGPSEVGSAKRRLQAGDVIVSRLRPYLRQVAYVDAALFEGVDAVVCSTEFYVLRPADRRSIAFLIPYLLSDPVQAALAASQEGGHHPRVPRQAVSRLPVIDGHLADRDATSDRVEALVAQVRAASRALASLADGPRR